MNKKTYKSLYSEPPGKPITPAQYIAELVCRNSAMRSKKDLELNFLSTNPPWRTFYIVQLKRCNSQLDEGYFPEAIISVLKNGYIYSLFPKWVEDKIKIEHDLIKNTEIIVEKIEDTTKSVGKKQKINKLEKLYG